VAAQVQHSLGLAQELLVVLRRRPRPQHLHCPPRLPRWPSLQGQVDFAKLPSADDLQGPQVSAAHDAVGQRALDALALATLGQKGVACARLDLTSAAHLEESRGRGENEEG
jgi:hypothetical protein